MSGVVLAYWAAAFVIGSLAVARVTRLIVDDDFPPTMWLRRTYVSHTSEAWGKLVECPFCFSFWLAAADTGWAFGTKLHWTWWLVNLIFAGAYVAAMVTVRDLPPDQR